MSSASCEDSAGKCQHCQQLQEQVDQQAEVIDELCDELAQLREDQADQQAEVIDELRDEIAQLKEDQADHQEHTAKERAEDRKRMTELEDRVEDLDAGREPHPQTDRQDSLTPIERLSNGDHDTVAQHVTPSIERAVALFEHLTDWGSKTPQGYTLRPADSPKQLLEAARDESLAWQQYYRAAEALEQLSRGAVTFFDHRKHGRTLVLHDDTAVHDRLTDTTAGRSRSSLAAD